MENSRITAYRIKDPQLYKILSLTYCSRVVFTRVTCVFLITTVPGTCAFKTLRQFLHKN